MPETHDDRILWRKASVAAATIVIVGSLIGIVSNSGLSKDWYVPLAKPAFQPPGWAFGVVWTVLYTMMGIAMAAILNEPESPRRRIALVLFVAQLALNFAWSPIFFGGGMIDAGMLVIVAMIALLVMTIIAFWRIRPLAGALLLPYLAWLGLAAALNFETGRLNPGADKAPLGIIGA